MIIIYDDHIPKSISQQIHLPKRVHTTDMVGRQLPKPAQKGGITATATWSQPFKMDRLMRS